MQCGIECKEVIVLAPTAHFSVSQIILLDQCSVNASYNHFQQERPPSPSVNPCIVRLCKSLIMPFLVKITLILYMTMHVCKPQIDNNTPLIQACTAGQPKMAVFLIDNGAALDHVNLVRLFVCPQWTWCGIEWCRMKWGMLYVCHMIGITV